MYMYVISFDIEPLIWKIVVVHDIYLERSRVELSWKSAFIGKKSRWTSLSKEANHLKLMITYKYHIPQVSR